MFILIYFQERICLEKFIVNYPNESICIEKFILIYPEDIVSFYYQEMRSHV